MCVTSVHLWFFAGAQLLTCAPVPFLQCSAELTQTFALGNVRFFHVCWLHGWLHKCGVLLWFSCSFDRKNDMMVLYPLVYIYRETVETSFFVGFLVR